MPPAVVALVSWTRTSAGPQKEQEINERISPVLNMGLMGELCFDVGKQAGSLQRDAGKGASAPTSLRPRLVATVALPPSPHPPAAVAGWEHHGKMALYSVTRSGCREHVGLEDTSEA